MSNIDLINIQAELKAPKNAYNIFGKYHYRSCEDILEAIKPLLAKYNCQLYLMDDMVLVGDRVYVKATVNFTDSEGKTIISQAFAREEETKKGMDGSQITGAASSYARKYALNGLFLIDDNKDADTQDNTQEKTQEKKSEPVKTDTSIADLLVISFGKNFGDQLKAMGFTNIQISKEQATTCGFPFDPAYDKDEKKWVWKAPNNEKLLEIVDIETNKAKKGFQLSKIAKIDIKKLNQLQDEFESGGANYAQHYEDLKNS